MCFMMNAAGECCGYLCLLAEMMLQASRLSLVLVGGWARLAAILPRRLSFCSRSWLACAGFNLPTAPLVLLGVRFRMAKFSWHGAKRPGASCGASAQARNPKRRDGGPGTRPAVHWPPVPRQVDCTLPGGDLLG
jgi:hypothetical protein